MAKREIPGSLKELFNESEELKKKLMAKGEKALYDLACEAFRDQDHVIAVKWAQYIPSFNDGDACEFGIRECSVLLANAEGSDDFQDIWKIEDKSLQSAMRWFDGRLEESEDLLETIFGNNAEVTVRLVNGKVVVDTSYDCGY